MKSTTLLFIFIFTAICSANSQELITLGFQKDLIPEGIAMHTGSQTLFLNSLRHGKIVKCNMDGTGHTDFIQNNQYGYLPGFGMTIKGDTLFALGNSLPKQKSRSVLLLLHAKTSDLIRSYTVPDTSFKYLNDLAVCANGDIFITDSESNKLYTVQKQKDKLELFMQAEEIAYSNGITVSDDEKYLYLASHTNGIRVVDRSTKEILNKPNPDHGGIDGMKFYKNSLVAIVNAKKPDRENGIYRFFLDDKKTAILKKEKIISFDDNFSIPTTFTIVDGYMYFIINSQLDNLDSDLNRIRDSSKLRPYQLMKLKLD